MTTVNPLVEAVARQSAMLAELVAVIDDLSRRIERLERQEDRRA